MPSPMCPAWTVVAWTVLSAFFAPLLMGIACYVLSLLAQHCPKLAPFISNNTIRYMAESLELLLASMAVVSCWLTVWRASGEYLALYAVTGPWFAIVTASFVLSIMAGVASLVFLSIHTIEVAALKPDRLPTSLTELFSYEPLSGVKELGESWRTSRES